jgi:2-C-methyl-D-erythritol 4-phosphate cytidylyltransferase/2-C-methyl-D-erythritol 2,4-cyclodiphosphate synthase
MGRDKLWIDLYGRPAWRWSLDTLAALPGMGSLALVVPQDGLERFREGLPQGVADRCLLVPGGKERPQSVLAGVTALLEAGVAADTMALVHDAARPGLTAELATATAIAARGAGAALPVLPVADTLWRLVEGRGVGVVERTGRAGAQTPQAAPLEVLRDAILAALSRDERPTDEAAALHSHGVPVVTVPGDQANRKLTDPGDEEVIRAVLRSRLTDGLAPAGTPDAAAATGIGFDAHRLVAGRPLRLAGLDWPDEVRGLEGHSDGDAALHAVIDALLGAARMGDIGSLFPADETRAGADSGDLLRATTERVRAAGWSPRSVDLALVAARPAIAPRRGEIEARIAELVGLDAGAVGVRGTTSDGLGFAGSEGIAAWASVTIERSR